MSDKSDDSNRAQHGSCSEAEAFEYRFNDSCEDQTLVAAQSEFDFDDSPPTNHSDKEGDYLGARRETLDSHILAGTGGCGEGCRQDAYPEAASSEILMTEDRNVEAERSVNGDGQQ